MDRQENLREKIFIILIVVTVMITLLAGETILMGWEMWAIVLLILGLGLCWEAHITDRVSQSVKHWMTFAVSLFACFFYGIHETSIYDLAPLMLLIIAIYSILDNILFIRLCVVTYYLTMAYDFIFVLDSIEMTPLSISRTMIHFVFVSLTGYLSNYAIKRRIEEQKNTNKKITDLEEVNRRTEDFLTNVSHELRTPINAVTGITSVMLKSETNDQKRKDIFAIQKAGNRLFEQIEDILDYTEIDTGRIMVSKDMYMITSIVNDIIVENQMLERDGNLELIFDIDANLPAMIIGDGRKIKKVLRHLIDNAYKFTKEGGIYVRIYALEKEYGINLCISVSDTGVGLDEEEIQKITERFYQSNGGRNRKSGGLGLGFPIVYGLVRAMEGFIQIKSQKDKGTTVCTSIPQGIADASPCMVVENKDKLCVGCYLKPEKYIVPQIRNYYDNMISNMVKGMELSIHRLYKFDELDKLNLMYELTHLFIGSEEYNENPSYFEKLSDKMAVIVTADENFVLPNGSKVRLFRKPFYCLQVSNILNSSTAEEQSQLAQTHMVCPNIRALVVDDEPMNLMVAEGILKDYRMNISTASSGAKAIEMCKSETFDLIFLDHMMPEMDGVETLKNLRKVESESDKNYIIIAFTANAVSGAKEMFLREGFDEFISKPIELNELDRILRKVLPKASIMYEEINSVDDNSTNVVSGAGDSKVTKENNFSDNLDDKIACLNENGINTKGAIQYAQGDKAFYFEILKEYMSSFNSKKTELENSYMNKDMKNYRIHVHGLKSSSLLAGANELSDMAKLLEKAVDDNDIAYIDEHHQELMTKYIEVVGFISEVITPEKEDTVNGLTEITKDKLLEQLQILKEKIEQYELDDMELLISDLCGMKYQSKSVGSLISDIKKSVDDFEYNESVQSILSLTESLERGDI